MIRRSAIVGIVVFWLVMNTLLVRLWLNPERSDILSLPVTHVFKEIFLHEQSSNLAIAQDGKRVGGLVLRPRQSDTPGQYALDFTGNLTLKLPFATQSTSFGFRGTAEVERSFALHELTLHMENRARSAADAIEGDLHVLPRENKLAYAVRQDKAVLAEASTTADLHGVLEGLRPLGVDPAVLSQITEGSSAMASEFKLRARQARLEIRGERVEVLRLLFNQGNTPLLQIDVSQLGQILRVKSAFGFQMAPDDMLP